MVAGRWSDGPAVVWVWFGARKLERWIHGVSGANGVLAAEVRARYRALTTETPWPRSPVLCWHLAGYLLPGVALYRTLLREGWSRDRAGREVGGALERDTGRRRRRFERRGRRSGFMARFAVVVRPLSWLVYPPPAWRIHWLERSSRRVAFDIDGCFYLDTLTALDARELTPWYCRVDDLLYTEVSPEMEWRRTTTMAAGGARCDFRFERRHEDVSPMPR